MPFRFQSFHSNNSKFKNIWVVTQRNRLLFSNELFLASIGLLVMEKQKIILDTFSWSSTLTLNEIFMFKILNDLNLKLWQKNVDFSMRYRCCVTSSAVLPHISHAALSDINTIFCILFARDQSIIYFTVKYLKFASTIIYFIIVSTYHSVSQKVRQRQINENVTDKVSKLTNQRYFFTTIEQNYKGINIYSLGQLSRRWQIYLSTTFEFQIDSPVNCEMMSQIGGENQALLSVRIVSMDYYLSKPVQDLDVTYSTFRSSSIKKVPVIRVFGSTLAGQKTCLHLHGIFPYIYVPAPAQAPEGFVYRSCSRPQISLI